MILISPLYGATLQSGQIKTACENFKTDLGWSRKNDNLSTQITKLRNSGCKGYILFSYSSIVSPACRNEMQSVRSVNNQQ